MNLRRGRVVTFWLTALAGVLAHPALARDVTFFAMGDPQYGGGAPDKNSFQVTALNAFPGTAWRAGVASTGPVAVPRGLLIAGDLTQSGRDGRTPLGSDDQIGQFVVDYGLDGRDGHANYPVYEGWGNHEHDPLEGNPGCLEWRWYYQNSWLVPCLSAGPSSDPTPGLRIVAERNRARLGLTRIDAGGAHYSWDWDDVHFVNLNLFGGDDVNASSANNSIRDPQDSLGFLRQDLALSVGSSGRPVVLMMHYGFDSFSSGAEWWNGRQQAAFGSAIAGYNVVAILHGHEHGTFHYTWQGYDVYNLGTPFHTLYNPDGKGHFTVFRLSDDTLDASDAAWTPGAQGTDPHWTGWLHTKPLCTGPDEDGDGRRFSCGDTP